jgi:acetyl-CoA acetyltransferase
MHSLRGQTAIVGAADTMVGKVPDLSATELCVDAALRALADAGISKDDVDGIVSCQSMAEPIMYHAEAIAEYMQIFPKYCVTANAGGGTTFSTIRNAAAAIVAGVCETVLISMADSLRSGLTRDRAMAMQSSTGHPQFEIPYGPTVPAYYALLARAHMDRFGTTAEQLAAVAVSARNYASQRPGAQMTDAITVSDVLESRMIADPLHLLDCSLVSDGGAAVILTSAGNARNFRNKPVYLLGMGEGHSHEHVSQASDLTTSAAVQSGREAYAMAGLTPTDIDVAQIYDCFTAVVLIELEDLGFCKKGEGGAFVESGASAVDGDLPMNTNGGLLSYCHPGNPGSMFGLTEAVYQLRGESGSRQVSGAETALVHGQGGIMSSHATLILGQEQVL